MYIRNLQKDLKISVKSARNLVKHFLAFEKIPCDGVSLYFVDQKKICRLHESFFDDPSPTDCISFPLDFESDDPFKMLGDVFVCPKTAIEYARRHDKDPYAEVSLYVIHGLLHLIGFDDISVRDRKKMRRAESKHLSAIESKKLWLHP